MRLIKTGPYVPGAEKLEIIQKWGNDIPPYAILSHTWSTKPEDEVLLADVENGTCSRKPAFSKLERAMDRAKLDGHGWVWIDTCCIDKSSSVELTEAINSMYDYYKNCQTCYAFLADVQSDEAGAEFAGSRWWRRGWTLQELLAPREVEFFNSNWHSLGSRNSLKDQIWERTRIDTIYLTGSLPVEHASIAKRMSWQALRETTREEDIAYSMLGIFDVNMPMLYGEGAVKAFIRLQEEIMKSNEDQSLFAWVKDYDLVNTHHGLLADSPKDFRRTGNTIPYTDVPPPDAGHVSRPQTLTARGLNVELFLTHKPDGITVAALNCPNPGNGYGQWLAVYLQKLNTGINQYARVACDKLASVSEVGARREVFVRQRFPNFNPQAVYPDNYLWIRSLTSESDWDQLRSYRIVQARSNVPDPESRSSRKAPTAPKVDWSSMPLVYSLDTAPGSMTVALLIKRQFDEEAFAVLLGAAADHKIGVRVCPAGVYDASSEDLWKAYQPEEFGENVQLEYHTVQVRAEEQVRDNRKIWFIDINVQAYPRAPTMTEILDEAIDAVVGPNKGVARLDLRDKMRRRIKSFK